MSTKDATAGDSLTKFAWERQPAAAKLVGELVEDFLRRCPEAATLAERMKAETGTRLMDWIDHIAVQRTERLVDSISKAGFVEADGRHVHPHGVFPVIRVRDESAFHVGIKVESVADFAAAHPTVNDIEGRPLAQLRWLIAAYRCETGAVLYAVERHGYPRFEQPPFDPEQAIARLSNLEEFRARQRVFENEDAAFELAEGLIDSSIEDIGIDATCDLFFAAEREYWQCRNRAAQFQKARQDRLGLGWANHDHHTYRCSRRHFARLIALWEKLGFHLRERFYAGAEAGWGAQVCEQPNAGIITFNDVDLSPEELSTDFAHDPLPERHALGTVGLWCALHGESILDAGMHHLECQFDFDSLRDQMERDAGIKVMQPFTDFPHLRQAFTEGERWPVREERIAALLAKSQITAEQADDFRKNGAIGSHLENLERNDGFKGFNQKGVSEIIAKTDPRRHS
jgi:hypothetical protein